ncbi:MAG TPA: sodium:calcium antiporter, partial [Gammaproteobacteria bacterium]
MVASGWILLGLGALIAGAELLTRAGSRLAAQLGVPPLVIGLTIVAVGTSAPELAIGIEA